MNKKQVKSEAPVQQQKVESPPKPEPTAKRGLKNLLPNMGQPIGSYGDRKTTTKLGGMAAPEQAAQSKNRQVEDEARAKRQGAMKESVIAATEVAAAATAAEVPENKTVPNTTPKTPSSNLSSLIQNGNPRTRDRTGVNNGRKAKTSLGQMAKSGVKQPEPQSEPEVEPEPAAVTSSNDVKPQADEKPVVPSFVPVHMRKQEAFQRALLSARIANDAKAKIFARSLPPATEFETASQTSSLSQMLQESQTKPTLSQQKAFANNNRHTSLFPEKKESHLSRLLGK